MDKDNILWPYSWVYGNFLQRKLYLPMVGRSLAISRNRKIPWLLAEVTYKMWTLIKKKNIKDTC